MDYFVKESRQTSQITSSIRLFSPNGEVNYPEDYEAYSGIYDTVLWVNAIIKKVALKAANVPWDIVKVEKKDGKEIEVPVDQKHNARRILNRPNERMTYKKLMQAFVTYLELNGDSYTELVTNNSPNPNLIAMYPVRPDRMKIKVTDDGKKIQSYVFQVKPRTKKIFFRPDDILHINYFSPNDDFYGQSSLCAAASTILKEQYTDKYQQNVVKYDAIPRGVLETDYDIEDDEATRILDAWKNKFAGINNSNSSIAILPFGLKFKPLQYAPKDIEYLKLLHDNRQRLFSGLGVNAAVMGIMDNTNRENYRMQIRSFYMDTVKPKLDLIKESIERFIFERFYSENLKIIYDYESQIKEDEAELSARLQKEILVGMRTPNEARKKFGEAPYEGGNTYYMMTNVAPIFSEDDDFKRIIEENLKNNNNNNQGLGGGQNTADYNRELDI
jgi:HK97 family phage portal protein